MTVAFASPTGHGPTYINLSVTDLDFQILAPHFWTMWIFYGPTR